MACLRTLTVETVFAAVQTCAPWIAKLQRLSPSVYSQQQQTT
jgi:hypothetical protein